MVLLIYDLILPTSVGFALLVVLVHRVVMGARRRRLARIAPDKRAPRRYADAYVRRSRWGITDPRR